MLLLSIYDQEQQQYCTDFLAFLLLRFRMYLRLQCFLAQLFCFVVVRESVGEFQNGKDLLQD